MNLSGDELAKLIEMAGFKGHPSIRAWLMAAQASPDPARLNSLVQMLTQRAALVAQQHPFLSPEADELAQEGVLLGNALMMNGAAGGAARLLVSRIPEHVYVAGAPGSGKSVLLKLMCIQLAEAGIPFLWFDTQGDVYPDLVSALGPDRVLWLPIKRAKLNPLEPLPGEEPMATLARFLDVAREALFLRDGSQNLLGRVTVTELAQRGVFQGSESYPSLLDISERLHAIKFRVTSRQGQFHETLINRFQAIEDQLSQTYDCSRGFNLDELAKRCIVFGLQGVSIDMQELFLKELLARLSALLGRSSDGQLRLVIVLDEAHRWASKDKVSRFDLGEILLFRLARELRKHGIGLILADQAPSQIAQQVLAVCNTRIVFRLLNGACMRVMSSGLALDREQEAFLAAIPARLAIIQSAQYLKPFVIEVPEVTFPAADETALFSRNEELLAQLAWVERSHVPTEKTKDGSEHVGTEKEPTDKTERPALRKELLDYLVEIAEAPFMPATERDKGRRTLWKGSAMRQELEGNGWIKIHRVPTGRKGAFALLELTPRAWDLLSRLEVKVEPPRGKGGFLHCYWQWQIKSWAEKQGVGAEIEGGFPGKQADVVVKAGREEIAFELEMSDKHSLINVSDDLRQFSLVVVTSPEEQVLERAERRVRPELTEEENRRVKFIKTDRLLKGKLGEVTNGK